MTARRHECAGGTERPEWALAVLADDGAGAVLVSAGTFDSQLAFDATLMLRPVPRCPFCGESLVAEAVPVKAPAPAEPAANGPEGGAAPEKPARGKFGPEGAQEKPRRRLKRCPVRVHDPRDADEEKVCAVCGGPFVNRVATARYCSPGCRAEAKRRNDRARKARKPSPVKKVERYVPRSKEQWEEDAEMWREIRIRSRAAV